MILDQFSRQSFLVDTTSGELNPPGWTRGAFGLFYDLKLNRWVLTHLPSREVFQFHFLSIEPACEAVLELETLGIDWERVVPNHMSGVTGQLVCKILGKRAEPFDDTFRRLSELITSA